jgi:hypothetical protein
MMGLSFINFVSWVGPFGPDHHFSGGSHLRCCPPDPLVR